MFSSYLTVALRFMCKNPTYTAINIIGLAIGLSCCLLILLYVEDELGYDRFHDGADRIYRLRVERFSSSGEAEYTSSSAAPMLPAALKDFSQIETGARISQRTLLVSYQNDSFFEESFYYADAAFFDVFSFNLLRGDPASALSAPNSLVLSETTAARYFPSTDPIGQLIDVEGNDMIITGIVEDTPTQSHFKFDLLASFSTLESQRGNSSGWSWWGINGYHTYLKLHPDADASEVEELIQEMPSRYVPDEEADSGYRQFLYLQPLTDIHLNSDYRYELGSNSQGRYVAAFAAVAFFLLLIACVNFMNLSTARSAERAKEVGMRKSVGARLEQLIAQFLGESIAITLIALVAALGLMQLLLPLFNDLATKSLSINFIERWPLLLVIVAGAVVVGVFAGIYPALALSSFKTVDALKGSSQTPGSSQSWLRQGLVVFQFSVSVALIIVAIIAQRQLDYMLSADVGFNMEQTLVINGRDNDMLRNQYDTFKESIKNISGVGDVTLSSTVPGRPFDTNVASRQRGMTEDGKTFYYLFVDHDFIDAYDLDLIAGRKFSQEMTSDESSAFILNEAAYKALGWADAEQPIGQEMTRQFGDSRNVIGVVSDFNFQSLHHEVEPLVLGMDASSHIYASVKMSIQDMEKTIPEIEQVWSEYSPGRPFEYFFLDQDFDNQYRAEIRISSLLTVFTLLTIGIACMGLFALASFVTQRRRREIAVRKVLGASTTGLITMLSYSFAKPVLIAALIAIPVSWYIGIQWLQTFSIRIPIDWEIFLIATALSLLIALLTVSWQALKAATASPSISLRSE